MPRYSNVDIAAIPFCDNHKNLVELSTYLYNITCGMCQGMHLADHTHQWHIQELVMGGGGRKREIPLWDNRGREGGGGGRKARLPTPFSWICYQITVKLTLSVTGRHIFRKSYVQAPPPPPRIHTHNMLVYCITRYRDIYIHLSLSEGNRQSDPLLMTSCLDGPKIHPKRALYPPTITPLHDNMP